MVYFRWLVGTRLEDFILLSFVSWRELVCEFLTQLIAISLFLSHFNVVFLFEKAFDWTTSLCSFIDCSVRNISFPIYNPDLTLRIVLTDLFDCLITTCPH